MHTQRILAHLVHDSNDATAWAIARRLMAAAGSSTIRAWHHVTGKPIADYDVADFLPATSA